MFLFDLITAPFKLLLLLANIGVWVFFCILAYGLGGWVGVVVIHILLAMAYWPKRNKELDAFSKENLD